MGRETHQGAARIRRLAIAALLGAGLALAWPASGSAASPKTITIAAATPHMGNCWPFGEASNPSDDWRPYFGFVYQNIPPFDLKRGDTLAFDLSTPNDTPIQLDMAMAPAANGTNTNTAPFTTILHNTQTPANPMGDNVAGNYELAFTAEAPFSFAGGGLIIRMSNPGAAFIGDQTCEAALVGASNGSDASGFFVDRVFTDVDGVAPWDGSDTGPIGQFRLILLPESNSFTFGKLVRNRKKGTATLPVTVPGKGTLALSGNGLKAEQASPRATVSVAGEGTVLLPIKPKGKLRKRLSSTGKAKVGVKVTFTPTSDPANPPRTRQAKLKLIKR